MDFELTGADGISYSLAGADISFQYGTTPRGFFPTVALSGSFALTSDATFGMTLRAETLEDLGRPTGFDRETEQVLEVPEDWTFTYGGRRTCASSEGIWSSGASYHSARAA